MSEKNLNLKSGSTKARCDIAPRLVHDEAEAGDSTLPHILLLIDKRGNREQVARQLRRHSKLLIPDSGSFPEQGFDLAIVDGMGLRRWHNELMLARQRERPVFLPVMRILSRSEMSHHLKKYRDIIDEFIITPIDTEEFFERTAMMLRARQFAVQQRQDLVHAVNHDPTTGLQTRESFLKHLEVAVQQAKAEAEKLHVVVGHVLMTRFTQILGPNATEDISGAIVCDLQQKLDGNYVMSRISTEMGATALPVGSSLHAVNLFSGQLMETMQRPRVIRGESVRPAAYVGIASYPEDATDAVGLLEAAISAANESPQRGVPHFYSPAAQGRALELLRIETQLHIALEQQEFELWFQPKFRLCDLAMTGAEALIRWRKPSGDMVSPGVFIPIAEQAGLIQQIDSWVIETACAALARWQQSGLECPRIAVNITPADLAADGFVSWLMQLIDDYGLTPSSIGVEVTESMLMNLDQNIQDSLEALRACGIRVSIDDFGTGYSSLSYLQQLPADALKIDKSFVDHIPHNSNGLMITNAIIALGEQFGLELIAEGIETREQLEYLRERGVQTGQGYLVSRPLPEAAFIEAMKNNLSIDPDPGKCPMTREKPDERSMVPLSEHGLRIRNKYQLAFEQSRDAINFMTAEGFTDCNPASLAMFRVPDLATFVSIHPGDLSPSHQPDGRPSREAAADYIDEALSQGQVFFEWRHRTWDGVEFPTEVLLSRIDTDDGTLVQAIVRDISDRKEAQALRAREQELAEAQRLAHLGSWISDFRTNEIRWSDEVYRIFGLNREDWGATLESFMAAVHPDDRAKVQAALDASFDGEPYEVDHRVIRPDGEVRTVLERGYTERDAEGEPPRMFGTVQDITEQRWLEDSLRRFAAILDSTPDIVGMHDGDGTMLYLNTIGRRFVGLPERSSGDLWQPMTGWDRSDLPAETESLEGTLQWLHPPWAAEKIANEGLPIASKEGSWRGETAVLDREGKEIPVSQVIIVHRDDAGEIDQTSTLLQDISKRRDLEDQLRREKDFSESILAGLPGIFYLHDGHGHLVQWNDRMEAVTGLGSEELGGMDVCALVPQEERDRVGGAIAKTFSEGSAVIESKFCTVEGDTPYLLNGLRVELNGQSYLLGIGLDITKQKQLEGSLEREATTDTLTGLYNRRRFDAEMDRALARHARYGTDIALVMIDVDHFKSVNDTYGHDAGDRVLVELSKRLAGEMRQPDLLARWGGEEFVALLTETAPPEAAKMAERLRRRIEAEPFPEVGPITISLGITSFQDGDTLDTLLKRVDNALYEAKRNGRNMVVNGEEPGA